MILIGDHGQVTVTDTDLGVKTSFTPEFEDQKAHSSFIFPRDICSFASSRNVSKRNALVVSLKIKGDATNVQVVSVDKDGSVKNIGTVVVPSLKASVRCYPSPELMRRIIDFNHIEYIGGVM